MVVGDTAGHAMPALAIAEAYREAFDTELIFLGARGCPSTRIIQEAGHPLELVPASAFVGAGPVAKLASVARLGPGGWLARRILASAGSRLVIGTGGFPSGSVLPAARSLGLCLGILEPNAVAGLANGLLGRIADRIWLGSSGVASAFASRPSLITGTPVRAEVARGLVELSRTPLVGRPLRVLVLAGSRGAFLAHRAPELLGLLRARGNAVEVRHQDEQGDLPSLRRAWEERGIAARLEARIEDMAEALQWADFAFARPGASTLAELALAALPALLVPLADAARHHQTRNAQAFAANGAALVALEEDWKPESVADRIAQLALDPRSWLAMSTAARSQATPDAARRIVGDCEELMRGRW